MRTLRTLSPSQSCTIVRQRKNAQHDDIDYVMTTKFPALQKIGNLMHLIVRFYDSGMNDKKSIVNLT